MALSAIIAVHHDLVDCALSRGEDDFAGKIPAVIVVCGYPSERRDVRSRINPEDRIKVASDSRNCNSARLGRGRILTPPP